MGRVMFGSTTSANAISSDHARHLTDLLLLLTGAELGLGGKQLIRVLLLEQAQRTSCLLIRRAAM
jgi:hypothetical protein